MGSRRRYQNSFNCEVIQMWKLNKTIKHCSTCCGKGTERMVSTNAEIIWVQLIISEADSDFDKHHAWAKYQNFFKLWVNQQGKRGFLKQMNVQI